MMTNHWLDQLSAEAQRCALKIGLIKDGAIEQLRESFVDAGHARAQLTILKEAPAVVVDQVPEEILIRSIASDTPWEARVVLFRMSSERLRAVMATYVERVVHDPASDWEYYRRTAEVLNTAGYADLLRRLTAATALSDDLEIGEVSEDFREGVFGNFGVNQ